MKIIILVLIMLLFNTSVNADDVCAYSTDIENFDLQISWQNASPEELCIEDNCWDRVILLNGGFEISGIGNYSIIRSDMQEQINQTNFGVLSVKSDGKYTKKFNIKKSERKGATIEFDITNTDLNDASWWRWWISKNDVRYYSGWTNSNIFTLNNLSIGKYDVYVRAWDYNDGYKKDWELIDSIDITDANLTINLANNVIINPSGKTPDTNWWQTILNEIQDPRGGSITNNEPIANEGELNIDSDEFVINQDVSGTAQDEDITWWTWWVGKTLDPRRPCNSENTVRYFVGHTQSSKLVLSELPPGNYCTWVKRWKPDGGYIEDWFYWGSNTIESDFIKDTPNTTLQFDASNARAGAHWWRWWVGKSINPKMPCSGDNVTKYYSDWTQSPILNLENVSSGNYCAWVIELNEDRNYLRDDWFYWGSDTIFDFMKGFTNTLNNGPAETTNIKYCEGKNGDDWIFNKLPNDLNDSRISITEEIIGKGSDDFILFNANDEFGPNLQNYLRRVGGYEIDFRIMQSPVANEYGRNFTDNLIEQNFFFAPPSSVYILPLGNDSINYYERNGYYEKDVYYIIKAQTYLDLNIKDLNFVCVGTNVECTLNDNRNNPNYRMDYDDDELIIGGKIRVNKNDIPKNIMHQLKLSYDITNLNVLGPDYNDINISSIWSNINIGYLDKQDFQVKIISNPDSVSCDGYNGLIGNTGEVIAPRINVKTNFPNGYDNNICSPENENWVYCSQRELLVTLANKIHEIFNLYIAAEQTDNQVQKNLIYQEINNKKSFEIYTRNINLNNLDQSLILSNDLFITDPLTSLQGNTKINNIKRAKELFKNTKFYISGQEVATSGLIERYNLQTGLYKISIEIGGENNDAFKSLQSESVDIDFITNFLFNSDDKLIDENNLNIKINFTKIGGEPLLDWFFYKNGVEDIDNIVLNENDNTFYNTQIQKRGQVMSFEQDIINLDISNIKIYPNYAIPLFTKVEKTNNQLINDFNIQNITNIDKIKNTPILNNHFSYWSGFASSLGEGCEEILKEETSLVYRHKDKIIDTNSIQNIFKIELYPNQQNNLKNGKEYLQTVIYSPILGSTNTQLSFNVISQNQNIYNKNGLCNSTNNCKLDTNNSNYKINWNNSLQDIINGIKNETICVTTQQTGINNKSNWTLFWNENEILKELTTIKRATINSDIDSKICEGIERTP